MVEIFNYLAIGFMLWMCMDCIQRREHFVWIIIIILLPPVGAVAYFFAIKNRANSVASTADGTIIPFGKPEKKEIETEETLQLKELIGKSNERTGLHGPHRYLVQSEDQEKWKDLLTEDEAELLNLIGDTPTPYQRFSGRARYRAMILRLFEM